MERKNFLSETEQNINRRSFLKLSGLLSAGLVSFGILPTAAEAVRFNKKMYKVTETRVAMNTFVSMTLLHPSRDKSEEAMGLAFEEIDRLTQIMSRFDNRTAVAQLNNEGFLKDVPPEVSEVISRALYHYRLSNATFDITIKPVMDLYKNTIARGGDRWPDDAEITDALKLVGADKIEFHTNKIRLKKTGMGIFPRLLPQRAYVALLIKTGTWWRRANTPTPLTWSICSWVTIMASICPGFWPNTPRRLSICLQLSPASINSLA